MTTYTCTGDKNLEIVQSTPLTTWVMTHGLNKYPAVTVVDGTGAVIPYTGLQYVDANNVQITFGSPTAGTAIFN